MMKLLTTLLMFVFFSYASAQEKQIIKKQEIKTVNTIKSSSVTINTNAIVISVKGIKTMEEIDIENYNKALLLNLIATIKHKPKMC